MLDQETALDILLHEVTGDILALTAELAAIRSLIDRIHHNPRMAEIVRQRLKELCTLWGDKRKGWIKRRTWDRQRLVARIRTLEQKLREQRTEFNEQIGRLNYRNTIHRKYILEIKNKAEHGVILSDPLAKKRAKEISDLALEALTLKEN